PAQHALGLVLTRLVGPEAGQLPPFALGDADMVRRLVVEAGFRDIALRHETMLIRWPSVETYLERTAVGSPSLHSVVQATSGETRQTLVQQMRAMLAGYIRDEELVIPQTSNLIVARA